ncbi:sigma-70 family RNA polymerase sigma factor [Blastopirellula sp. JC732]|uniref:Sigma-70 family RNA polymerase sigma factor n=1 Tax=Blastopirellula sediminis TaxID=2894196 RepID=A0A9X1SH74_9BACT|nr:sigma-70 family RNA polymerase sigma factor [Blastopirellula sediminis]MCC9608238.1 sigma-70 family RNA polymerase sigma factor [Blastopirellula sediminis]MCC9626969.1 sigma-70 family RNA polymerase sigma factor [Blastopirellula sediminis]
MSAQNQSTLEITTDESLAAVVADDGRTTAAEAAFLQLYERYSARVLTFLRRLGLDHSRAEDAAQETWQKVWDKLPENGYKSGSWFRPWLFHVARNCGMDMFRAAGKFKNADGHSEWENAADNHANPIMLTLELERMSILENCLKRLEKANITWARVFRSRMAGQRFGEICAVLEISKERAHRILFDAKRRMSDCVQGAEG